MLLSKRTWQFYCFILHLFNSFVYANSLQETCEEANGFFTGGTCHCPNGPSIDPAIQKCSLDIAWFAEQISHELTKRFQLPKERKLIFRPSGSITLKSEYGEGLKMLLQILKKVKYPRSIKNKAIAVYQIQRNASFEKGREIHLNPKEPPEFWIRFFSSNPAAEPELRKINSIKSDTCPSIDLTANFGPIRDQGGHGLCWAFTVAGLLEEHLCLVENNCGEQLSPLDVSSGKFGLYTETEGGNNARELSQAMIRGVCREIDAPYQKLIIHYKCIWDLFKENAKKFKLISTNNEISTYIKKCFKNKVTTGWEKFQSVRSEYSNTYNPMPKKAAIKSSKAAKRIKKFVPNSTTSIHEIESNLIYQDDVEAFFRSLFIPSDCVRKRISFDIKRYYASSLTFWGTASSSDQNGIFNRKLYFIVNSLQRNRSLGTATCLDQLAEKRTCKRNHAMIINGMRRNKEGICEVHLRNHWGKNASYDGWINAAHLINATHELSTIHEVEVD